MLPSPEQITPQWLSKRLQKSGISQTITVTKVEIGDTFESTAAFITPLKVVYSSEPKATLHNNLIFKRYREDWFGGGLDESIFYNDFASRMPEPPTFRCYDFDFDRSARQCYFIFEDASVTHETEPPKEEAFTVDLYNKIIDEILKLHLQWWEHPSISQPDFLRASGGPLRMIQAATEDISKKYCTNWKDKVLPAFASKFKDEFSSEKHELVLRAIEGWETLYSSRFKQGNRLTLLHGDLHRFNIFYPKNPSTHGLYFADWETYKRGIGPYDLCYLLADETAKRRREIEMSLLRYYHNGLKDGGLTDYSWDDCVYDYRLSVIAILFPTLAWQRLSIFESRLVQFNDWNCEELIAQAME